MQITIDTIARQVTVDGQTVPMSEIDLAAHQDQPAWLLERGLAVPPQDDETRALATTYRGILEQATAAIRAADSAQRQARIRSCSGHRADREEGPWGYAGQVARAGAEWPPAHGGVGYTEICRCGAQRKRLVNGSHVEMGVWA